MLPIPPIPRIRPLLARRREWAPLAILIVALASALALGGDRGYLYRPFGIHNELTAKNMAVAENLSPKHNFRLTTRIWTDEDGGFEYRPYGRFPIGGYALIKLAILPFGGDFAAKLIAARLLMLLMFCGAALLAYLALARIAGSRWIALAAVLLAFSSLYSLYYSDSVAGETAMDLFGIMLVFHGMVLLVQEGRFRQLLVKTCAALLLGWHVYALILPFALLSFGGEALAFVRANAGSNGGGGGRIRASLAALPSLARSRFVALAAVSVLFGSALLAFNFAHEYAAYGGSRDFRDLPSVNSMIKRLELTDGYGTSQNPLSDDFLYRQFHYAGVASAPYAVAGLPEYDSPPLQPPLEPSRTAFARAAGGVAAACWALAALALVPRRFRLPLACLALTGFIWALAARGNATAYAHNHEGMFHIGLPLALWAGALIGARRLLGARLGGALAIGTAALAAPVFALSAFHAAQIRADADAAKRSKELMADMSAVREYASPGNIVTVSRDADWLGLDEGHSTKSRRYYLTGIHWQRAASDPPTADYALSRYRDESFNLLTPGNRHVFLYESIDLEDLYRAERRRIESSPPDAESFFDVYLAGSELAYLKSPCVRGTDAVSRPFFLRLYPVGASARREWDFAFSSRGVAFDDVCMTVVELPDDYPTAAIRTGQSGLWEATIFPPPNAQALAAYENAYQAVADGGEPSARSGFDLYLDADVGALSYLKQPCTQEDARGRFFLSVHPANPADLPAERREIGHESLNFDFEPPLGAVFNGKCMATIQLPDYPIDRIETGQDAPGAGRLWSAAIAVGD